MKLYLLQCTALLLACARLLPAQSVITTIAGTDPLPPVGQVTARTLAFPYGAGVATDSSGNLYVAEAHEHVVYRIDPNGMATVAAGNGICAYSGDGGAARLASLGNPYSVAVDSSNNLYIADRYNNAIRRVTPDGIITSLTGDPTVQPPVPGSPEPDNQVYGVAIAPDGRVFYSTQVQVMVLDHGVSKVFAGTGDSGYTGDGGPATQATLSAIGPAFDKAGNLHLADADN